MDQGGRLQGLAGLLLREPSDGQPAQLIVDQRQELVARFRVTLLDGREDLHDIVHGKPARETPAAREVLELAPASPVAVYRGGTCDQHNYHVWEWKSQPQTRASIPALCLAGIEVPDRLRPRFCAPNGGS